MTHRLKTKAGRIAREQRRAKPMPCGHGSRHRTTNGCAACRRDWYAEREREARQQRKDGIRR